MKIRLIKVQTPAGVRSAYLALPDRPYEENGKASCVTFLREGRDEASVWDLIRRYDIESLVEEGVLFAFPDPIGDVWSFDGGDAMTDDEAFIESFASSYFPSGAESGWRVMGDVRYLAGIGSGASLVNVLASCHISSGLAAAIFTIGGILPEKALERATNSPVPAYLIDPDGAAKDYYLRVNAAHPVGGGRFVCDHNSAQQVFLKDADSPDSLRDAWTRLFRITRRTNTSPTGDVDRRILPDECGLVFHTLEMIPGEAIPHSWIEHCPARIRTGTEKVPLLLFSHGMSDNPLKAADMTKFHEIGEREGFITVYPFSSDRYRWNLALDPNMADDMAYYEALIAYLCDKYPVDRERIYLSGFSNGAGMAMVFAMSHPALIAAACPVDSTFPYATMGRFRPGRPSAYVTKILSPGEKAPDFMPPKGDPEKNLYPLRRALELQKKKQYRLPLLYFYGSRESEYPIATGSNQELSYNFWKEFNGIATSPTADDLTPDAVGVPGETTREFRPDPTHPDHTYAEHVFYSQGDPARDYYHFLLMRGKAHEVHPAEREIGWAFVSRFRRKADGSLTDSKNP